jgi:hypothetical protein
MKMLSFVVVLLMSVHAYAADGNCKIGIDTDNLNESQTALVLSMIKQLQGLGCTVGAPESHSSASSVTLPSDGSGNACPNGTVSTAYGCLPQNITGTCTLQSGEGKSIQGVIYNGQCLETSAVSKLSTSTYPVSSGSGYYYPLSF